MTKRGRPKFPAGKSKAVMLSLRLKPDECVAITKAAKSAGQDVSEYVRSKLLPKPKSTGNTTLQWPAAGVFVQTPEDMPRETWEMLCKYVVNVLKPTE